MQGGEDARSPWLLAARRRGHRPPSASQRHRLPPTRFGFVSFTSPIEADAALAAIHGSWVDGREMKVEKTKEDGA